MLYYFRRSLHKFSQTFVDKRLSVDNFFQILIKDKTLILKNFRNQSLLNNFIQFVVW